MTEQGNPEAATLGRSAGRSRRRVPVTRAAIRLRVNGAEVTRTVEVRRTLADFLREDLGLTGTHVGCEHGVCGACTVLLDGQPVRSCLIFAVQAAGCQVTTVEALGEPDRLSPLQQAFVEHHALQCGFCTPGILMSMHALLQQTPHPSEVEIREALGGHLCRCTGYHHILDAVRAVASKGDTPASGEE
jgi:carbon-monoxide dehydrogenase small subunit